MAINSADRNKFLNLFTHLLGSEKCLAGTGVFRFPVGIDKLTILDKNFVLKVSFKLLNQKPSINQFVWFLSTVSLFKKWFKQTGSLAKKYIVDNKLQVIRLPRSNNATQESTVTSTAIKSNEQELFEVSIFTVFTIEIYFIVTTSLLL